MIILTYIFKALLVAFYKSLWKIGFFLLLKFRHLSFGRTYSYVRTSTSSSISRN